ncbi:MAG: NUDIX domain-containing protein [Candidatus Diapherotrites archaeon]
MPEQKYPEPVVGAFIFNPQGKVFLMKSFKWKGDYTFPGGHIKSGEKLEDAVKREVKEETGLNVYNIKFVRF